MEQRIVYLGLDPSFCPLVNRAHENFASIDAILEDEGPVGFDRFGQELEGVDHDAVKIFFDQESVGCNSRLN